VFGPLANTSAAGMDLLENKLASSWRRIQVRWTNVILPGLFLFGFLGIILPARS
jgi:hypothetical protein